MKLEITEGERKLFLWALDKLSDELGRHGCNDFDLEHDGGLTQDEWGPLTVKMELLYAPDERRTVLSSYSHPDFCVAAYLRSLFEEP